MSWSEEQFDYIETAERIGSTLSLFGSFFIIATFLSSVAFRKPARRIIFYATLGNIMSSIATLVGREGVRKGPNSALCQFQAFFIQLWMPADAFWAFCMVLNLYLTLCRRYSVEQLQSMEWKYFLACYGIPLPTALALWFAPTPDGGRYYGPSLLWCSIAQKWNIVRVACFYAPAGAVIVATLVVYIIIARNVRCIRRSVSDISRRQREVIAFDSHTNHATRTAEFHNELHTESSLNSCSNNDHLSTFVRRDVMETEQKSMDDITRRYLVVSILFFLALIATWLPSMTNRVYSIVHPEPPIFWLNLMAAFVLTLQGFWNAMVYLGTSWALCRDHFLQKLRYFLSGRQLPRTPDATLSTIETNRQRV